MTSISLVNKTVMVYGIQIILIGYLISCLFRKPRIDFSFSVKRPNIIYKNDIVSFAFSYSLQG